MKIFMFVLFAMIIGCGGTKTVETQVPVPQPTQTPGPGGEDPGADKISYQKMQGYLNNYCQSCHSTAQFMSSETALRASQVKANLWSKRMPPANASKALPENIRTEMITFF